MLQKIGLALSTSFLLWLAWPENGFAPFLFIAFIPLLLLERQLSENTSKKTDRQWFWYNWLCFGTWNLLGTWWLVNAHWSGLATTVIVNGFLMTMVMVLFRFIKRKLGNQRGYISLPFLWISFESFHRNWDLSFPWLTLGNGFAENAEWIQWYEYTGVFGGSLWIWIVNLTLFGILIHYLKNKNIKATAWRLIPAIILLIVLPIFLSGKRYHNYTEEGKAVNVVVVQPNIDVYDPTVSNRQPLDNFLKLSLPQLDDSVDFLIGPEALLSGGLWENNLDQLSEIQRLKDICAEYEDLSIMIGASTLKFYKEEYASSTARPLPSGNGYYDSYNTALFIQNDKNTEVYHKSKLVAGVEMTPFTAIVKPMLGGIISDFGGISGALGTQKERSNFYSSVHEVKIAPSICWESDFGEYTAKHVRNGASLIFLITNDDWWGNTQGHRQHMHYARLRAIENRRSIARSANTGISCFINQRGDFRERTTYKTEAVIKQVIRANDKLSYYSKTGDLLSRLSFFMSGFFILYGLVYGFLKHKNK